MQKLTRGIKMLGQRMRCLVSYLKNDCHFLMIVHHASCNFFSEDECSWQMHLPGTCFYPLAIRGSFFRLVGQKFLAILHYDRLTLN